MEKPNLVPIFNETDVAWIVDIVAGDLAKGHDTNPAIYREHVHDVIGAIVGRGVPATVLRVMIERGDKK
jgi:hypothetical protein